MSEQQWVIDRGYPFIDPITQEQRRAKWESALARPDAELEGTFEEGFSYVVEGSGGMLRARVRPVRADEQKQ